MHVTSLFAPSQAKYVVRYLPLQKNSTFTCWPGYFSSQITKYGNGELHGVLSISMPSSNLRLMYPFFWSVMIVRPKKMNGFILTETWFSKNVRPSSHTNFLASHAQEVFHKKYLKCFSLLHECTTVSYYPSRGGGTKGMGDSDIIIISRVFFCVVPKRIGNTTHISSRWQVKVSSCCVN